MRSQELSVSQCQGTRSISLATILMVSHIFHHNASLVPLQRFVARLVLNEDTLSYLEGLLCPSVFWQFRPTATVSLGQC